MGAASLVAREISRGAPRTAATPAAEVPLGEPWPAPGPPQPADPKAVVGAGNCRGISGGAMGVFAGAWLAGVVISAAGAVVVPAGLTELGDAPTGAPVE
jgi:hypothetical protein